MRTFKIPNEIMIWFGRKESAFNIYINLIKLLLTKKVSVIKAYLFKKELKIPRTSFYRALNVLQDEGLIEFKDGNVSLKNTFNKSKKYFRLSKKSNFSAIAKSEPKKLVLETALNTFLLNKVNRTKVSVENKCNELIHWNNRNTKCSSECLQRTKVSTYKMSFTYNIFKYLNLSKKFIYRFIKQIKDSFNSLQTSINSKFKRLSINKQLKTYQIWTVKTASANCFA